MTESLRNVVLGGPPSRTESGAMMTLSIENEDYNMSQTDIDSAIVSELQLDSTIQELGASIRRFASARKFDYFLLGLMVPTSPVKPVNFVISGYPKQWKKIYDQENYLRIDPVIRHCLMSLNAVFWSDIRPRDAIATSFFQQAANHGLVDGVTCPMAGRRGERGFFSLARSTPLEFDQSERVELTRTLHWFVATLYEAIIRVAFTVESATPTRKARQNSVIPEIRKKLSDREKQILLLFAGGRKCSEIANSLKITERTVWWHFQKAGEKLEASGREEIISKAQSSGAISLAEVGLNSGLASPSEIEFVA